MTDILESTAAAELKRVIERIECLEGEKANTAADIKEIYDEAKGRGYDTKTLKKIIALRKKDEVVRRAEEELLELYLAALGE